MPRTGPVPVIGESPTTGAVVEASAGRMSGTERMVPMLTTLDMAERTMSVEAMASPPREQSGPQGRFQAGCPGPGLERVVSPRTPADAPTAAGRLVR